MRQFALLISPTQYLRVRGTGKAWFDWLLPVAATAAVLALIAFAPRPVPILGERGLVEAVNEVLQVMVGFYIAALAAIATFKNRALDQPLAGEPTTLFHRLTNTRRQLNRRAFLSLLFAYLAFLSLAIYLFGSFAQMLHESLLVMSAWEWFQPIRQAALAVYLLAVSQLATTTLLGLHYLGDRIHRPDPQPLGPADPAAEEEE